MFKYKAIRKRVPWCEECDSEIHGNGSIITPYHCTCSTFEFDLETNQYKIYDKRD